MNSNSKDYMLGLFLVSGLMSDLLFTSAYGQLASNDSSQSNQSTNPNISEGIGSAKEWGQVLSNNSEIIANNTPIGNPNASIAGEDGLPNPMQRIQVWPIKQPIKQPIKGLPIDP